MLISIILPVYNGENTLVRAIESVVTQNCDDIELIIINDGSTDSTLQIIEKYVSEFTCIKYINKQNGGSASARNAGLEIAKGRYILFLDADDAYEKNAMALLKRYIYQYEESQKTFDFLLFGLNIYQGGLLLRQPNAGNEDIYIENITFDCFSKLYHLLSGCCNKLYKRDYIRFLFDEKLVFSEDLMFNFQNIIRQCHIVSIETCLYDVQLSTENSVNKRYAIGKIDDICSTRKVQEDKMTQIFGEDFRIAEFHKHELGTLLVAMERCVATLGYNNAKRELWNYSDKGYMNTLLADSSLVTLIKRIPLRLYKKQRYFLLYLFLQSVNLFKTGLIRKDKL